MYSILIVDRDIDNLITLTGILRNRGYCVIAKTDGASALSVLKQGADMDLVVADYELSDMDARDFMTSLKRTTSPAPPVIFLGDRVDVQNYLNAFSLGAFEFLFRPVHPAELARIAHAAIRKGGRDARASAGSRGDQAWRDSCIFPADSMPESAF